MNSLRARPWTWNLLNKKAWMNEWMLLCIWLISHLPQTSKDSDSVTRLRLSLPPSAHLLYDTMNNSKHCHFCFSDPRIFNKPRELLRCRASKIYYLILFVPTVVLSTFQRSLDLYSSWDCWHFTIAKSPPAQNGLLCSLIWEIHPHVY